MTNNYLRTVLRFGVSFFISSRALHKAAISATPFVPTTLNYCMQGLPSMPVPPSQFYTPLHARLHTLPPCSSPSFSYSSAEEDGLSASDQYEDEKQLPRSHSSSKLHACKLLLMLSFKSLRHRGASSRNHLDHADSCANLQDFEEEKPCYYTRSWSSPSLHKRQQIIKLPRKAHRLSRSSDTCKNSCNGSRSGKCAPKGHVGVYVEAGQERHVVPITYLSHPLFQALLERAEREYGYRQEGPGLRIPCSLSELRQTLHRIRTQ